MFKLIGKQQKISDTLVNKFKQTHDSLINDSLFLSGEMGTGKTYMGSYINYQLFNKNNINVIISPSTMIKKWINVLNSAAKEYSNNMNIIQYKSSMNIHKNYTYVMSYITFTKFIQNVNINDLNMIIIDEIQKCRQKMIENIAYTKKENHNIKYLFLTGTIFDSSTEILFKLLEVTHHKLMQNYITSYQFDTNWENNTGSYKQFNLIKFINYIWKYISVSISLNDLKESDQINNDANLVQEIAPIKLIDMSEEEKAYYSLIINQAKIAGMPTQMAARTASDYLDLPSKKMLVSRRIKKIKYMPASNLIYQAGLTLSDITLSNTNKYKQLMQILKEKKQTLIYITDEELGEKLNQQLKKDGYNSDLILSKKDTDKKINNSFKENTIVITNPKLVTVGVDIEAEYLVWYQLLNKITDILQAQRRITRLNSKLKSKVFLLGYNETHQQEIINEISNGAKNNAAAYGFKDKSNLAKLTGVLLQGID